MANQPAPNTSNDKPDLELLGQRFYLPDNLIKLAGFAIFFLCLTFLLWYMVSEGYWADKTETGWTIHAGKIKNSGDLDGQAIVGFWTPSDSTQNAWVKEGNTKDPAKKPAKKPTKKPVKPSCADVPKEHEWQTCCCPANEEERDIEKLNSEFGEKLIKEFSTIGGYRRSIVMGDGDGDSELKEGWWWQIGLSCTPDKKFLIELEKKYKEHWDAKGDWSGLYVEIIGNFADDSED